MMQNQTATRSINRTKEIMQYGYLQAIIRLYGLRLLHSLSYREEFCALHNIQN